MLAWEGTMASRSGGVFPSAALFIGLLGIFELVEKPRFQMYHAVDVLQLIASGMCLGVALMWVIVRLRDKPTA
jgi:hypothetical protein